MRRSVTNTYDPETRAITLSADRAAAYESLSRYYAAIFGDAETFPDDVQPLAHGGMTPDELRDAYAIATNTGSY